MRSVQVSFGDLGIFLGATDDGKGQEIGGGAFGTNLERR